MLSNYPQGAHPADFEAYDSAEKETSHCECGNIKDPDKADCPECYEFFNPKLPFESGDSAK